MLWWWTSHTSNHISQSIHVSKLICLSTSLWSASPSLESLSPQSRAFLSLLSVTLSLVLQGLPSTGRSSPILYSFTFIHLSESETLHSLLVTWESWVIPPDTLHCSQIFTLVSKPHPLFSFLGHTPVEGPYGALWIFVFAVPPLCLIAMTRFSFHSLQSVALSTGYSSNMSLIFFSYVIDVVPVKRVRVRREERRHKWSHWLYLSPLYLYCINYAEKKDERAVKKWTKRPHRETKIKLCICE